METARAFVGCLFDLATTRRVVELQRALRKSTEAAGWRVSWVPPPNVHVTLKFLGDVDLGLMALLSDAVASVAAAHRTIRVDVDGVGAFPAGGEPRVLFAQIVRGQDRLAALAADLESALYELGLPKETRAFHPHATLGRVRRIDGTTLLRDLAPPAPIARCGTASISDVTLYRSDLLREGVEYHVIARHALRPAT